jgi:hypothetical protein
MIIKVKSRITQRLAAPVPTLDLSAFAALFIEEWRNSP